jgi:putative transposase
MPRALRIEYPGAIYHIMNRGDRREPIFRDDANYKRFRVTLAEACTKTDWQVHAYCLMLNHFQPRMSLRSGRSSVLRKTDHGPGQ